MDFNGLDCCDAAANKRIYKKVNDLHTGNCEIDQKLRIKPEVIVDKIMKKKKVLKELYQQVGEN